jgi:peptide-methionine (S)-S-oxide reductase
METTPHYELATFSGGCFWDLEAGFRKRDGVLDTMTGYTGGSVPEPGYGQVSSGTTGHAEAVQLVFDPGEVTYDQLLDRFWTLHDPFHAQEESTRSAIFYHSREQKESAETSRDRLQRTRGSTIVTELLPFEKFWRAEECHQQYYEKCGQGYCTSWKYWE